jgi:hypothetical protein
MLKVLRVLIVLGVLTVLVQKVLVVPMVQHPEEQGRPGGTRRHSSRAGG